MNSTRNYLFIYFFIHLMNCKIYLFYALNMFAIEILKIMSCLRPPHLPTRSTFVITMGADKNVTSLNALNSYV